MRRCLVTSASFAANGSQENEMSIVLQTTIPLSQADLATYTPAKGIGPDDFAGVESIAQVSNGFFEAMWQASRGMFTGLRAGLDERGSPSEMFEPASSGDKSRQRSGAGAQPGDRPGDRLKVDRYDRTSIAARQAPADVRSSGALSGAVDLDTAPADRLGTDKPASSGNAIERYGPSSFPVDEGKTQFASYLLQGGRAETLSIAGAYGTRRALGSTPTQGAQGIGGGAGGTVSRVSSTAATTGSTARSPASVVGQLLGTGQDVNADGSRQGTSGTSATSSSADSASTDLMMPSTKRLSAESGASGRAGAPHTEIGRSGSSTFDQLVRSIHLKTAGQHSSARLQLDPPELGRMAVDIRVDSQRMTISVRTETDAARLLVQERVAELVAALEAHGISVERVEVSTQTLTENTTGSEEPGSDSGAEPRSPDEQSSFFHSESTASEDASSLLTGSAEESESTVVAETRLDIRV